MITTQPWTVRAAVDLTSISQYEKVMKIFACHMEAPDVDWVLSQTMAQTALDNWCREAKGSVHYERCRARGKPTDRPKGRHRFQFE